MDASYVRRRLVAVLLAAALVWTSVPRTAHSQEKQHDHVATVETRTSDSPTNRTDSEPLYHRDPSYIKKALVGLGIATAVVLVVVGVVMRATGADRLELNVLPSRLDFGNVAAGSSSELPVAIENSRSSPVRLTAIPVSGDSFSLAGAPVVPLVLQQRQRVELSITFAPTRAGRASGRLELRSDTSDRLTVGLSGVGR